MFNQIIENTLFQNYHIISIVSFNSYNSALRMAVSFSGTEMHWEPSSRKRGGNFSVGPEINLKTLF